MKEVRVHKADHGQRLDKWMQKIYPQISFNELQRLVRKKLLRVDGKRADLKQMLSKGQVVRHPDFDLEPKERNVLPKPAWLDDAVLYKDDHIIVLNKPAGLATQGGTGQTRHLDGYLPHLQYGADGIPKLVHRLDKDTSGALVLARTLEASRALVTAFRRHQVVKSYLALCSRVPEMHSGQIEAPLVRLVAGGEEKMAVDEHGRDDAKDATTRYAVQEVFGTRLSLLECFPQTGRKHQLRVHLAYLGCPIIGDGKYGGQDAHPQGENLSKKLHLHARELHIPAEVLGHEVTVTAPLPPHFADSLKHIGAQVT